MEVVQKLFRESVEVAFESEKITKHQPNMNNDAVRCGAVQRGAARCDALRCGDNCWVSTHRVNRELRLCPVAVTIVG